MLYKAAQVVAGMWNVLLLCASMQTFALHKEGAGQGLTKKEAEEVQMDWIAGQASHQGCSDTPAHHENSYPVGQAHTLCHQLGRYLKSNHSP